MEKNKNLNLIILISVILILFSVSSIASATTEKCTPSTAQYAYVTNTGDDINNPGNTVSVINMATNKVTATIKVGTTPIGIAVTPDGKKVFTANGDNSISIIDATKNKVIKTISLDGYDGVPYDGAVSPDGKRVYFLDGDQSGKKVLGIDTTKNKLIDNFYVGATEAGDIAISPDGSKLYVSVINLDYVNVLDLATKNVTASIKVGYQPDGIAISPDGKKAYVANNVDNTVSIINTAKNTVIKTVKVGQTPTEVAISPNGKQVYVTNSGNYLNPNNTVSVIDTATYKVKTIKVGKYPNGIIVSPDGKKVYVVNTGSNNVSIIGTATNKVIGNIKVGYMPTYIGMAMKSKIPAAKLCKSSC